MTPKKVLDRGPRVPYIQPMPAATTNPRIKVTCYKCHGSKRFEQWSGIADGVCFTCQGAGTVMVDAGTPDEVLRGKVAAALWSADFVMELVSAGPDLAHMVDHYAARLVRDMMDLGRPGAMRVLDHVLAGMYRARETDDLTPMPRGTAGPLRDRLVQLGRDARAQVAA